MMVRRVTSSHAWLSSDDMFSLPPLFFLFSLEKCVALAKNQKGVLFIIFIIFDTLSFSCIKLHLFFQLHALAFDFYIKFGLFIMFFSLILYGIRGNLAFASNNFFKKWLPRTSHVPACGRHPHPFGGACDASL